LPEDSSDPQEMLDASIEEDKIHSGFEGEVEVILFFNYNP